MLLCYLILVYFYCLNNHTEMKNYLLFRNLIYLRCHLPNATTFELCHSEKEILKYHLSVSLRNINSPLCDNGV